MVDLQPFYQILEPLLVRHKVHLTSEDVEALIQAYAQLRDARKPLRITEQAAWAYAAYRMPGTLAANTYVLDNIPRFEPSTLLDLGCGAAAASWAWLQSYPSLKHIDLVEQESGLLEIATSLLAPLTTPDTAIRSHKGKLQSFSFEHSYDVILLSYVVNELPAQEALDLIAKAWAHTNHSLVIVDPGHKQAFRQLMFVRDWAIQQGIFIQAPCSHAGKCPLVESDWCHFTVRFQRSTRLRQLKKANLGYEDEPFCYLILSKTPQAKATGVRIVKDPQKIPAGIKLSLCAPEKVGETIVTKKNPAHHRARKKRHGDVWLD